VTYRELVQKIEAKGRLFLATALNEATPSIENQDLVLAFTVEQLHLRDTVARPENIKTIRDILPSGYGLRVVVNEFSWCDDLWKKSLKIPKVQ
jgi:hypothetical protein